MDDVSAKLFTPDSPQTATKKPPLRKADQHKHSKVERSGVFNTWSWEDVRNLLKGVTGELDIKAYVMWWCRSGWSALIFHVLMGPKQTASPAFWCWSFMVETSSFCELATRAALTCKQWNLRSFQCKASRLTEEKHWRLLIAKSKTECTRHAKSLSKWPPDFLNSNREKMQPWFCKFPSWKYS